MGNLFVVNIAIIRQNLIDLVLSIVMSVFR